MAPEVGVSCHPVTFGDKRSGNRCTAVCPILQAALSPLLCVSHCGAHNRCCCEVTGAYNFCALRGSVSSAHASPKQTCPVYFICIFHVLTLEREERGERDIHMDFLFRVSVRSLVASCVCPDWGWNLQPRRTGTALQPTEVPRQGQTRPVEKAGLERSTGLVLGYEGKRKKRLLRKSMFLD